MLKYRLCRRNKMKLLSKTIRQAATLMMREEINKVVSLIRESQIVMNKFTKDALAIMRVITTQKTATIQKRITQSNPKNKSNSPFLKRLTYQSACWHEPVSANTNSAALKILWEDGTRVSHLHSLLNPLSITSLRLLTQQNWSRICK